MTTRNHNQLVISIHGIRDFGKWQERLERLIDERVANDSTRDVRVVNYHFGYFSVIAFFFPPFRWLVTRKFRNFLVRLTSAKSFDRIDLVGHSFGTHILGWALFGIDKKVRPRIHSIILAGSVLRSDFPWERLLGTTVHRVVNDCGAKDVVLLLSQFFVLFTGMAGRSGFSGGQHDEFRNRYSMFGHGGYFEDWDGYGSRDGYMILKWLPILLADEVTSTWEDPRPKTVTSGIMATLANNIEPVKIIVYASPLILGIIWIGSLYRDADNARALAETGLLAAESGNVIAQHPFAVSESAALGALSVKTGLTPESRSAAIAALKLLPVLEAVYQSNAYQPEARFDYKSHKLLLLGSDGGRSRIEVWNIKTGDKLHVQTGAYSCLRPQLDISNGGALAAVSCDTFGIHKVMIFSPGPSAVPLSIDLGTYTRGLAFDAQGQTLVIGAGKKLTSIDTASGEMLSVRDLEHPVLHVAASPLRNRLAVASEKELTIFDAWRDLHGSDPIVIPVNTKVQSLYFSPNGKTLYASLPSIDQIMVLQEQNTWQPQAAPAKRLTEAIVFSPDGNVFYVGDYYGEIQGRRTKNGEVTGFRVRHGGSDTIIGQIQVDATGRHVASIGADRTARVWQTATHAEVARFTHRGEPVDWGFFLDDSRFLTIGRDNSLRVWRYSGELAKRVDTPSSIGIATPDSKGNCLVIAAPKFFPQPTTPLTLYCFSDWEQRWQVQLDGVSSVQVRKRDDALIVADAEGLMVSRQWRDQTPPKFRRTIKVGGGARINISNDGEYAVEYKEKKYAKLYSTDEANYRQGWDIDDASRLRKAQFYGSGKYLVLTHSTGHSIIDTATRSTLIDYPTRYLISEVDISRNDKLLAVSALDSGRRERWERPAEIVDVIDIASGEKLHTFNLGAGEVSKIAIAPNGNRIAIAFHNSTVYEFEIPGFQERLRFTVADRVRTLHYQPQKNRLIVGTATLSFVDTADESFQVDICQRLAYEKDAYFQSLFFRSGLTPTVSRVDVASACALEESSTRGWPTIF